MSRPANPDRGSAAAAPTRLVERIRALLAKEPVTREVAMFGGRCFLANERIVVSAGKDGSLLVRVAPQQYDELLGRPGVAPATMGGRAMGPGWVVVAAAVVAEDRALASWLRVALQHNLSMTRGSADGR